MAGLNGSSFEGALYASKHNLFILYNDIRLNPARAADIKPYTGMAADLNSPDAPRYVWISPDQCNDMHGGIYTAISGYPETPCPYSNVAGDANDEALKAKATRSSSPPSRRSPPAGHGPATA